jgi:hypothetical protein
MEKDAWRGFNWVGLLISHSPQSRVPDADTAVAGHAMTTSASAGLRANRAVRGAWSRLCHPLPGRIAPPMIHYPTVERDFYLIWTAPMSFWTLRLTPRS